MKSKHESSFLPYILITNLFYPAILGALFYFLLADFSSIIISSNKFAYALASLAIVISFSVDFLYTYSSKRFYSKILFLLDIFILLFLIISYKDLIDGIKLEKAITLFFVGFILIHSIFIIWDLLLIPNRKGLRRTILFDFLGLLLALIGLAFFRHYAIVGMIFLWIHSFLSILTVLKDVLFSLQADAND
ncbi:MAG: hypothetical protein ACFFCW_23200 [Candidatus Hodarchaeota archaeon]